MNKRVFTFLIPIACAVGIWPVWIYFIKFGAGENILSLFMLTAITVLFIYDRIKIKSAEINRKFMILSAALLITLGISAPVIPNLGKALIGLSALGMSAVATYPLNTAGKRWGLAALFPLSLPMEATLQFTLGYPLRRLTAVITNILLLPLGTTVEGTTLYTPGGLACDVDAPCSGVLGLWAFIILGNLLAYFFRFGFKKWAAVCAGSVFAALFYNILRASVLFMAQLIKGEVSDGLHSFLGIMAFAVSAALFLTVVFLLDSRKRRARETD